MVRHLPLKIGLLNRKVVFQPSIFRGYVSCRECTLLICMLLPTIIVQQKSIGSSFHQVDFHRSPRKNWWRQTSPAERCDSGKKTCQFLESEMWERFWRVGFSTQVGTRVFVNNLGCNITSWICDCLMPRWFLYISWWFSSLGNPGIRKITKTWGVSPPKKHIPIGFFWNGGPLGKKGHGIQRSHLNYVTPWFSTSSEFPIQALLHQSCWKDKKSTRRRSKAAFSISGDAAWFNPWVCFPG